jgi:predicted Fe-Mo cluster-binding NifX family protein
MLRICITAQGPTLEAPVDTRFSRCANFTIIDPDTLEYESTPNPGAMTSGGAGAQAAQFVIDRKVDAVLTGHVGPGAYSALNANGIPIYVGISGSVRDAIAQFQSEELTATSSPTVPTRSGKGKKSACTCEEKET